MLSIRREHREPVETLIHGDLFQIGSVDVDQVEIEVAALGIAQVGGKDNPPAIRMEKGTEVGGAIAGHLNPVGAVGVHHEDVELARLDQVPTQQVAVLGFGGLIGGMRGAVDDFLTVGRVEGAPVVAEECG